MSNFENIKTINRIPTVKRKPWGWLCLALNIFPIAGAGSILAGLLTRSYGILMIGIFQAIIDISGVVITYTTQATWPALFVFFAWIWSIVWGIKVMNVSIK